MAGFANSLGPGPPASVRGAQDYWLELKIEEVAAQGCWGYVFWRSVVGWSGGNVARRFSRGPWMLMHGYCSRRWISSGFVM